MSGENTDVLVSAITAGLMAFIALLMASRKARQRDWPEVIGWSGLFLVALLWLLVIALNRLLKQ